MGKKQRALTAPRIVLDTNIVLSALLFNKGHLTWLREAWQSRHVLVLASRHTVEELIRVFAYPKFKLDANAQETLLADYLPYCETIQLPHTSSNVPHCRDKHDLPFLWLALSGKANYLVTGDEDLLSLRNQFSIPIITANHLREIIGI